MAGDLSIQGDPAPPSRFKARPTHPRRAGRGRSSKQSASRVPSGERILDRKVFRAEGRLSTSDLQLPGAFAGYQSSAQPIHAMLWPFATWVCAKWAWDSLSSLECVQGIQHGRRAVEIFATLASARRGSTSISVLAFAHPSALGNDFKRLAARPAALHPRPLPTGAQPATLVQQSLNQLQTLKQRNLLAPYDLSEPDRVAREVANCDANLKDSRASDAMARVPRSEHSDDHLRLARS